MFDGIGKIGASLYVIQLGVVYLRIFYMRIERRSQDVMMPGYKLPFFVDAGTHPMIIGRPVIVVLYVVFAGPDHLDGGSDISGDHGRFNPIVVGQATSEPTACKRRVNTNRLGRKTEFDRQDSL